MKLALKIAVITALGLNAYAAAAAPKPSAELACRAGMGVVFGYPASHMKAQQLGGKQRIVWQARSDRSMWATNCWLEGKDRIMWQSVRADGSIGRVRNHAYDAKVLWKIKGKDLIVTELYSDGSRTDATTKGVIK